MNEHFVLNKRQPSKLSVVRVLSELCSSRWSNVGLEGL